MRGAVVSINFQVLYSVLFVLDQSAALGVLEIIFVAVLVGFRLVNVSAVVSGQLHVDDRRARNLLQDLVLDAGLADRAYLGSGLSGAFVISVSVSDLSRLGVDLDGIYIAALYSLALVDLDPVIGGQTKIFYACQLRKFV